MSDELGTLSRAADSRCDAKRLPALTLHKASQHCFELLDSRRLEEVVVETCVGRTLAIGVVPVSRERNQDAGPAERTQATRERVAVDVGKTDGDEREIDREAIGEHQRRRGVERDVDHVAERLEEQLQAFCRIRMRLHDQKRARCARRVDHWSRAMLLDVRSIVGVHVNPQCICTAGPYAAPLRSVQYRYGRGDRTL